MLCLSGFELCSRWVPLITITVVKLQMFGGETCHVHVKIDRAGHGNNRQK